MEWNVKSPLHWDWENTAFFGGKENEISNCKTSQPPPPPQPEEWRAEGGIVTAGDGSGSLYSSAGGFSGSELGNGSSNKSSISASIDSSSKAAAGKVSVFNFAAAVEGDHRSGNNPFVEDTGTSSSPSVGEPLIGLKLGKRTYFEDVCAGNNSIKDSSSSQASRGAASSSLVKKTRMSHQSMQSSHCQVEGCNIDLTGSKDYHRKHRVCETHSKCPKVVVAGQDRRFCQQCSRFHDLSEFDQKKRSCRRRLSDHNARRRKPQPDTISFNSSRISPSFYDDRQQMNFLLNKAPYGHIRPTTSSTWEDTCGFSLTHSKGSWIKSTKVGGIDGQLHFPNSGLSNTVPSLSHDLDKLLPFKCTNAEVLTQGLEASVTASDLDGAPDIRRALSLLSNDSWGSADPGQTNIAQFVNPSHSSAAHSATQEVNTSSGYWQEQQPLPQQGRGLPFNLHNGSQFQEFQLFKAPFETSFFDSGPILPKADGHFLEFKT